MVKQYRYGEHEPMGVTAFIPAFAVIAAVAILLLLLTGCGRRPPRIVIGSDKLCEQGVDPLIRLAHECAQGGGKYPEDCINAGVAAMCPEVTGYRVVRDPGALTPDETSAFVPCSKAKEPDAIAACKEAVH